MQAYGHNQNLFESGLKTSAHHAKKFLFKTLKQGLEEGTLSVLGVKGIGKTKNWDGEPLAG